MPKSTSQDTAVLFDVSVDASTLFKKQPRPLVDITNAEFVDHVFRDTPAGAAQIVCTKEGDPTKGGWVTQPALPHAAALPPANNNYINCASVTPDSSGQYSAKKERVAAYHFVLLDDVGAKVATERLNALMPTWAIETSPGNFQWGIALTTPIRDLALVKRLQDAIFAKSLCDPGANGATRWARLPVGVNGKEKYRDADGKPFRCRLAQFDPTQTYTVDELISKLELVMSEAGAEGKGGDSALPVKLLADGEAMSLPTLRRLVGLLDPNMGRGDWLKVLMAVWYETNGSDDGFQVVDVWSSKGKTYGGQGDMQAQWLSFRPNPKPVTGRTLVHMARATGTDLTWLPNVREEFSVCETIVVCDDKSESMTKTSCYSTAATVQVCNPLMRFAVSNRLEEIQKNLVENTPLLGQIALAGQSTVIYAKPNTGKTLVTLHLVIDGVVNKRIDASKLYYLNMDDGSAGLLNKCRLANEYGFHMLSEGYLDFKAAELRSAMDTMVKDDSAKGVVIVLDTLKKFTNTMNKEESSGFALLVRQFCLKGGTVIALAHTNKRADADGNPIYAGTSDIVDDFDCAYTLKIASADSSQVIVEFNNFKRRGDVATSVSYCYSPQRQASYENLLLSVRVFDAEELLNLKQQQSVKVDSPIVAAARMCIAEGINTKMKLVREVKDRTGCTQRDAIDVIDRYAGPDSSLHHWSFEVVAKGAKVYSLLDSEH